MKRFSDLTDTEVLGLTEEQIQRWIDLECAEEGVKLLPPHPGDPPKKPEKQPDVLVYSVAGLHFADPQVAEACRKTLEALPRLQLNYDYRTGSHRCVGSDPSKIRVEEERYWSELGWAGAREEVEAYDRLKAAYEKDLKAWQEANLGRQTITSEIRKRFDAVQAAEEQRRYYREELTRYVNLADGNEEVAKRFLLKAHPQAKQALWPEPEEEVRPSADRTGDQE